MPPVHEGTTVSDQSDPFRNNYSLDRSSIGDNRLALMLLQVDRNVSINSVTVEGDNATQIDVVSADFLAYYYVNPPTSSSTTYLFDLATNSRAVMIVSVFSGVDQSSPLRDWASEAVSSTSTSVTVSSSPIDLIITGAGELGAQRDLVPGTGITEHGTVAANAAGGTANLRASIGTKAGASGNVTTEWTVSSTESLRQVAASFRGIDVVGGQGPIWFMFENARSKYDEIFKPRGYNEPILVPEAA